MVKTLLLLAAIFFSAPGIAARTGGATVAPVNAPTVQATPLAAPAAASTAPGAQIPSAASIEEAASNGTTVPQTSGGFTATAILIVVGAGLLIVLVLGLWLAARRKAGRNGHPAQSSAPAAPRREPQMGKSTEAARGEADRSRHRR